MRSLASRRCSLLRSAPSLAPPSASLGRLFFSSSSSSTTSTSFPSDGSYGDWIDPEDRGSVFGHYAEDYDTSRPDYPDRTFERIFAATPQGPINALDVATGTGRGAFRMAAFDGGSKCREIVASDADQGMLDMAIRRQEQHLLQQPHLGEQQHLRFIRSPAETLHEAVPPGPEGSQAARRRFPATWWPPAAPRGAGGPPR